jgi:hypothetical protein
MNVPFLSPFGGAFIIVPLMEGVHISCPPLEGARGRLEQPPPSLRDTSASGGQRCRPHLEGPPFHVPLWRGPGGGYDNHLRRRRTNFFSLEMRP